MRRENRRSAFTFVELLIVIGILALLMGLLFPALQSVRTPSHQNNCRNNLRNLALATIQFEKRQGQYPGFVNELHPENREAFTRRSWIFMLLPYLERLDLYESHDGAGSPQPQENIDLVVCPSQEPRTHQPWSMCSYVCNSGLPDFNVQPGSLFPADYSANGVFHDRRQYLALSDVGDPAKRVPIIKMSEAYISTGDGTSNTILLVENMDALSWVLVGDSTGGPSNPRYERQVGCTWNDTVVSGALKPPAECLFNKNVGGDPTFIKPNYARPSSPHPQVVNVAFCDGHVRTLSQQINYKVYCLLMAPRDKSTLRTDGQYPATPQDDVVRKAVLDETKIN